MKRGTKGLLVLSSLDATDLSAADLYEVVLSN